MPELKEYRQQVGATGAIQMPHAQDAGIGAGLERLGSSVLGAEEVLMKRQEQAEISDNNVRMAQAHAKMTTDLKDALNKAGTPGPDGTIAPIPADFSQKFIEKYDDEMAPLRDNVQTRGGQMAFDEASARLKMHLFESATAGQAQLAGDKAIFDFSFSQNARETALMNDPTPSSLEFHKKAVSTQVDELVSSGQLPAHKAIQLKAQAFKELAQANVRGYISNGQPEVAKDLLKNGVFDDTGITGDLKHSLMTEAVVAIHGKEEEAKKAEKDRLAKLYEEQVKTQNDFLQKAQDDKLTVKDILSSNLDPVGSGSKDFFIKMLGSAGDDKIKTDPGTMISLFNRIHADDSDPRKIRDENELNHYFGNGLKIEDLQKLRGEIASRKTSDGRDQIEQRAGVMKEAWSALVKTNDLTKLGDPAGQRQYNAFLSHVLEEEAKAKKDGTKGLYDPSSANYLGKSIKNYVRDFPDIIRDKINTIVPQKNKEPLPEVDLIRPGESAVDYLKRRGKH